MYELEVVYNSLKTNLSIQPDFFILKNTKEHISIPTSSIVSVFVKDLIGKFSKQYLLKIKASESHIISFRNSNLRDLLKGYLTSIIKEQDAENIETGDVVITYSITSNEKQKSSTKIEKNIKYELESIKNIESSKSSYIKFIIDRPIFLVIFNMLDCTLTQFYNYLKQSYFYDYKNKRNVIDRMLNENIRNYQLTEYGIGARLNTHSFIEINVYDIIKESTKNGFDYFIEFIPIYQKDDNIERKKLSEFKFSDELEIKFSCDSINEDYVPNPVIDKKALIELLTLCKLAFKSRKENTNVKNIILEKIKKYEEILINEAYQSFDPRRYFEINK